MDKITIIVPVYNVEKYLGEAIESAIQQTYQNLEIILIDDGSKDSSGQICDSYAKKDNRIKVFHQENKGLSGARNTGLKNATGKYIMFLDSDDKFTLNACQTMYDFIEKTHADYAIGDYINMDEDGTLWENPVFKKNIYHEFKLSIKDYEQSFYIMNSGVWNKIFRKSFLDSLAIQFVERIPAEDAVFTTYCFIKSKNVYYIPEIVYEYRQRYSDSISNSCSKKYFEGINKAYHIIYDNFKENDEMGFYRYFYAKSMNYILYKFIDSDKLTKEERIDVLEEMKWFYTLSNELKIPTILKSLQYIIEAITQKDYEQVLKYCEILNQVRKMLPKEIKEKMSKPNANTYKQIEENAINTEIARKKEELLKVMATSDIKILTTEECLQELKQGKSIARFGNGELDLIIGKGLEYQTPNKDLIRRLQEILQSEQNFCMIGIPDEINKFENLTEESENFWINYMYETRPIWLQYLHNNMQYCTSSLSRLYIRRKDHSNCGKYFSMIKDIWKGRNVLICETSDTKTGIGNDLLSKCNSVRRIICPRENTFDYYDTILAKLKKEAKDTIILTVLGPTATVLAYDLAQEGYQALDLGHLDTEYELYQQVSKNDKTKHDNTDNETDYKKQIDFIIEE